MTCKACTDKADLVAKVRESIHMPEKAAEEPKASAGKWGPGGNGKEPDLEEILSRLKGMPGMENMNVRLYLLAASSSLNEMHDSSTFVLHMHTDTSLYLN